MLRIERHKIYKKAITYREKHNLKSGLCYDIYRVSLRDCDDFPELLLFKEPYSSKNDYWVRTQLEISIDKVSEIELNKLRCIILDFCVAITKDK
jgi:hypothetical protein